MSIPDPAYYRTELCLATTGDWYLMRDGGVIAVLHPPEDKTVTYTIDARAWACHLLTGRGITVTGWVNGMDLPEHDSGYWVTEPWEDSPAARVTAVAS